MNVASPMQLPAPVLAEANAVPLESDEAIMLRLAGGESRAATELIGRHGQAVGRYLQRLLGDELAAEELLQQTWLSILENSDKFDPNTAAGGFKAWLFRIATNKANDHWRRRGRDKSAMLQLRLRHDEIVPDASARPQAREQAEKMQWAIAQLPENQRQVLLMRYYADLKFVQIAQLLGCPLNTALGRMHKATIKLRELLADD